MKKKLLIVLFAFVMVFSLVGCGNNNEALNDANADKILKTIENKDIFCYNL